jgi:hypothetical protein
MFESGDKQKSQHDRSRCTSISTIDSVLASEIARQHEASQSFPNPSADASSRPHNNMTFDKSEGIHVGDVINYYYHSPSIEGN